MKHLGMCFRMETEHVLRSQRQDFVAAERLHGFAKQAVAARFEEFPNAIVLALHLDEERRPMFDSGSAVARPQMRSLLRQLGKVLEQVPNKVAIEGHTDGVPFPGTRAG